MRTQAEVFAQQTVVAADWLGLDEWEQRAIISAAVPKCVRACHFNATDNVQWFK